MIRQRFHFGIVAAVLAAASGAHADVSADPAAAPNAAASWSQRVPLGRPPVPTTVELQAAETGVVLHAGSSEAILPLSALADVKVERVTLAGGAAVAVLRVAGTDAQRAGAVLTRVSGQVRILFSGPLDLRGDPGERSAYSIEVADRNGDGRPDVIVAEHNERARVCGQAHTALYPRAIDPKTLALRPVVLNRLAPSDAAVPELVATETSPGPDGPPLLHALGRAAVSSLPGVRDLAQATPTAALTDGDTKTYWSEGRGGGGRGEFATFNWEGGIFPLRALAITPRPDIDPMPRGLAAASRVILTGHDGSRLSVSLPADAKPGVRYWVVPPQPLAWRCLSVVFDQTHPLSGSQPGNAMLAEIEAYTDLDFGAGEDRLLASLSGSGPEASRAADLAVALGERIVPRLAQAFATLSPGGRRRALRVLSLHAATSAPARVALASALEDKALRQDALEALLAAGDEGFASLAPRIAQPDQLGDDVALALAKQAPVRALDPVLAAMAARGGTDRPALRDAISQAVQHGGAPALAPIEAWNQGELPDTATRAAVALALAATPELPAARELAVRLVASAHVSAVEFPDVWRLVQAATSLPSQPEVDAWLRTIASQDERWMLRAAALGALVARSAAGAMDVAVAAIGDTYPRVRMRAAAALSGQASALGSLTKLARDDRWAMVRAAALDSIATMPGAVPTLTAALSDHAQLVRAAAVRGLTRARARDAWPEVEKRLLDAGEWPEVVTESIGFARAMCIQDASGGLIEVLRRGLKPNAWAPDQDVALVAFDALLDLGGEAAKAAVSAARSPLAPGGFKTAIEKTKHRKPACQRE